MGVSRVTIFHTSDEHGHLENAARIAYRIKAEEALNPGGVYTCSSGDTFSGSAVTELRGPGASRQVMEASGYRYGTLGNHDTDLGEDFTRQWVRGGNMVMLTANVVDSDTGHLLPGCKPYDVVQVGGARIGFFGLATPETPLVAFPGILGRISVTDPVSAGRKAVAALRAEGANVIINLSHLGDADTEFAQQVPGMFILGGHTHETWAVPQVVNGVPIYHSGAHRQSMTRLDLDIDTETNALVRAQSSLIPIRPEDPEDAEVAAIVNPHLEATRATTSVVVGYRDTPLAFEYGQPNEVDQVLAQGLLESTGADLAFINHDFSRGGLPAGPVTLGHVLEVLPFPDTVRVARLSARDVAAALTLSEQRDNKTSLWMSSRENRYVSKDGQLFDTRTQSSVSPDVTFRVATTDYLLSGGLAYFTLPESAEPHGPLVRDMLIGCLQRNP